MVMKELPYEIWQYIVAYLPAKEVRRLYCVNRVLLNIALDLRYQEAKLGVCHDQLVGTGLRILHNSFLHSRPRALRIVFYNSSSDLPPNVELPAPRSLLSEFGQFILEHTITHTPKTISTLPISKLKQIPCMVISRLPNVSSLSITYGSLLFCDSSARRASLMFPKLWGIFQNRLKALHIQSCFAMFLPTSLQLQCLDTFSIFVGLVYHPTDVNTVMAENVFPFLLAHTATIRNVSFSIAHSALDISTIPQRLKLMSCLHNISISVLASFAGGEPFDGCSMLLAHQHHLRSLTLLIPPSSYLFPSNHSPAFFIQNWCLVKLPYLRDLTIRIPRLSFSTEFITYFGQFSTSLVSLDILKDHLLTYDEVESFCNILPTFTFLQKISLSVIYLFPEILALFGRALPYLCSLRLDYRHISHCKSERRHIDRYMDGPSFSQAMAEYSDVFSHWKLESINGEGPICTIKHHIGVVLARYIPNLVWV